MNEFILRMQELSGEDQTLVLTFLEDMRISYDPDWVTLTYEEEKEIKEIEGKGDFVRSEEVMKELEL